MSPGPKPGEAADTKSLIRNKQKKGQLPYQEPEVKTNNPPADVQGRKDATDPKKGGYSRVDDSLDVKKPSGKPELGNTTKGGEVRTIRPPDSPSGNESRKLGKLNQNTGKLNTSANKELQAKRKLRVDTTTGKATPKGVENYAQGRGGYGRTTGKPRNMGKPEWESRKAQAKQIAKNPGSKAYKDIQKSIEGTRVKGREGVRKLIKSIPGKTSGKTELGKVKGYVAPSDYAGKRAQGINPTTKANIKAEIKTAKQTPGSTIRAKSAPLNVPNKILGVKTNSKIIDTPKRRLKIVNKGVNQADVSKEIAKQNKAYNAKRVQTVNPDLGSGKVKQSVKGPGSYTGSLSKGNLKFSGDANYQAAKKNLKVPPKKTVKQFVNQATGQTSLFNFPEKPSKNVTQGFRPNNTPDPNIIKKPKNYNPDQRVLDFNKTKKPPKPPTGVDITDLTKQSKVTTGNKLLDKGFQDPVVQPKPPKSNFTSNTTGKLSDTAWRDNTKKGLKPSKTFKQFASKFPKPVRSFAKGSSRLLGKAVGPAFAVADGIGNYKSYKKQGYNTSGAIARSGAKTGAYWGGWAAGAKGGAALGAALGSVVPLVGTAAGGIIGGIAGGIAGGHLAGKTADWAIKGYDTTFGKQKLKDIKAKNIAKMNAKALKADPWKAYKTQPKVSNNRIATNKGNLRTITLKKGKDGSYIMPKGFTAGGTVNRTTQLATKTG